MERCFEYANNIACVLFCSSVWCAMSSSRIRVLNFVLIRILKLQKWLSGLVVLAVNFYLLWKSGSETLCLAVGKYMS